MKPHCTVDATKYFSSNGVISTSVQKQRTIKEHILTARNSYTILVSVTVCRPITCSKPNSRSYGNGQNEKNCTRAAAKLRNGFR